MSIGEIAFLGLVVTCFTVFAGMLAWVSTDRPRRARPAAVAPHPSAAVIPLVKS